MAKLKINELKVTGTELFEDSESFLHDLTNEELKGAVGGRIIYTYPITPFTPYSPVIL
ncbi:MAG TPA: hypothetical protein VK203_30705 [Nostocaceae cyanobacterium]|nr:hypothetical protein [Nostocaceae cyanobacterium]